MIKTIDDVFFAKQIEELDNQLFTTEKYTYSQIQDIINSDKYKVYAYFDDKIVGYLIIYKNIDFDEIFKIGVAPNYQKKGIGTKLLNFAKEECDSKLFLEVSNLNVNAVQFYLNNGFRQDGYRKDYYGKNRDAILMEWVSDF